MKPTIVDAISVLKPNVAFSIKSEVISAWDNCEVKTGETQPTQSEIDAKLVELIAEYDAQAYARNRAPAYPSIGDQLDMQYHDEVDGTTTWVDAVAKVKADNPK